MSQWIKELGIYDYRHRMCQPELGRFLQTDPMGLQTEGAKLSAEQKAIYGAGAPEAFSSTELNLYRYCNDDPVDNSDALGLAADVDYYRNDDQLKEWVKKVNSPGNFILAGHGSLNPARFGQVMDPRYSNPYGNGPTLASNKVIGAITGNSSFSSRAATLLLVCNSGAPSSTLAREIAAASHKPVIAPTSLMWFNKDGTYFVADKQAGTGPPTPDLSKPGKLVMYEPDGSSRDYMRFKLIPGQK